MIDTAEQSTSTKTSSTGTFTLPTTPSYKYVVVSQGGTDSITGKTALTMLSPGGAASVSPLTTLVELDTTGNLAATLNSLLPAGKTFDSDLTAGSGLTPAAMVFLNSVMTAATTLTTAIQDAATKSGTTLTAQQLNNINLTVLSQIASQFAATPVASLTNTATVASGLQTSLCSAINGVASSNSNITGLSCSIAATIANTSVAVAANVVGNATGNNALKAVTPTSVQTSGVAVSTTPAVTESTVMTASNTQLVTNAITSTASSSSTGLTVTSTPTTYTPPVIAVANNPSVVGYNLVAVASGNLWDVRQFTITFSDDMVASGAGDSSYSHSVLNPANYQFSQTGCTPTSYASKVLSLTCGNLPSGAFTVTLAKSSSTAGAWASATSLGLLTTVSKTFSLTAATGSTSVNLF
ncbi:hypothetical protein [Terriglobus roseus]|uniref:hypothetical protein n=1 Tax=Terriglobus roseus TaxID=392734 RepID=UPI000945309B|nr:hypothetical protein [Terriglobus roseus]